MIENTEYALPEKLNKEEIDKHVRYLFSIPYFVDVLNSLSTIALVINKERQVIFASDDFLSMTKNVKSLDVVGLRPGEILHCKNRDKHLNGCGTSQYCRTCGFVNTILESQDMQQKVSNEARIVVNQNNVFDSLDLKVTVSPLKIYDEVLYIVTILDLTSEKRRALLERMFFHDVLNTAGGFYNLMEYVEKFDENENDKFLKLASLASKSIYDQIISFKQLSQAECDELQLNKVDFYVFELIHDIIELFNANSFQSYEVVLDDNSLDFQLFTDKTLLYRVITNMVKNATEAPSDILPSIVIINTFVKGKAARISVTNSFVMPESVQFQVFQRSFSTKSEGRGVGTYSMKLIGEKYLGGKVDFVSSAETGTVFFIDLPVD